MGWLKKWQSTTAGCLPLDFEGDNTIRQKNYTNRHNNDYKVDERPKSEDRSRKQEELVRNIPFSSNLRLPTSDFKSFVVKAIFTIFVSWIRICVGSYFMGNKDIFDEEDRNLIQVEYDSLVNNLLRCNKPGDRELIDKAFAKANEAHWNMRRKSGEPYIIHPISVAKIVNREIGLGAKSIAVALLHDVVEDTEYSLEDVERDFGSKIASLN